MLSIVTGVVGRSRPSRSTSEIRSTTSWPRVTWPKTVCLPSSHGVAVGRDDEELRAVRVRPGVRHRERALDDLVVVELVLELVAGAAGAGALRAAALDHEVGDHAVEDEPVVEAFARELREVRDRLRGLVGEELDLDRALAGVKRCLCHGRDASRSRARLTAVEHPRLWRPAYTSTMTTAAPLSPRFPPGRPRRSSRGHGGVSRASRRSSH